MKCCICKIKFDQEAYPKHFPFCSERCSLVDLGRWLGEDYSFMTLNEGEEDENFDSLDSGLSD